MHSCTKFQLISGKDFKGLQLFMIKVMTLEDCNFQNVKLREGKYINSLQFLKFFAN